MALAEATIVTHNNDGSGTWAELGTQSSSQNTDIFLTSTGSRAKKVSNSTKGFMYQVNATGRDMSAEVACVRWAVTAGVGSLGTRTSGGVSLAVQDTSGNISYWDVDGNDTYGGGWKVSVVDLSTTPSRNNGTNATLTLIQYVGMEWTTTTNVGGGDPNCYIDQVLSWPTAGITITGDSTAFIDDLVDVLDVDQGVWERRSGVVFSKARLILTPGASDFAETDRKLIFENPVYDAGATIDSCLAEQGIESADADVITFTRCLLESADPDEAVTTDANREFDFTSAGDSNFDTCQLVGFDGTVVHLGGSGNNYDDCTFQRLSQIVDTGAIVRRGFVRDTQAAAAEAALLWTTSSDWQDTQFVMGATNSHAMEIETNITDSWTGFTFTGYNTTGTGTTVGDEVLNANNPTGGIIINASDITGTISWYLRGAGSDPTINNNVSLTFTGMKDNTEVRIYNGAGVELDGIEDATAGSPGDRSFTASVAGSTVVDVVIFNKNYILPPNNRIPDFTWPSSTATLPIQQIVDRNFDNPP